MLCSQCGKEVDEGNKFCGNCGARVVESEPESGFDPASAARPEWPSPASAKAHRELNKPLVIAAVVVLIIILGGAGVYFAMMRPSGEEIARSDENPDRPADTGGSPDTMPPSSEEVPGAKSEGVRKTPPASAKRPSSRAAPSRRAGVAGPYETVRDTSVFEKPSASSRIVSNIPRGYKVEVVGSTGNWLEVRSTSGKPPGFIRRSDALPADRRG